MRAISATLLAAQQADSNTPYVHLLFTSKDGLTTYDYSSDQEGRRILLIDYYEEPYNGYASIVLRNNDRSIPEIKGYWIEIGYGCVTGLGNEYVGDGTSEPGVSRLWVKNQQTISAGGKLYELLQLEGMWERMREDQLLLGTASSLYTANFTAIHIYDLIITILAEYGMTLAALGTQDDTIVDTFSPEFEVNYTPFEDGAGVISRLIQMTKGYLRADDDLGFTFIYPQATDPYVLVYYSHKVPYFYEYTEQRNVLVPNHIYVVYDEDSAGTWNGVAEEAKDQTEIDTYADVARIYPAANITISADALKRAQSILARLQSEILAGKGVAPHDCRLEMYDKIQIEDTRGVE